MNTISEQLLKAVEIIADEKISQLQYDKTIQAKIFSIVNLDIGEYKVRYKGNIFSVFSNNLQKTYKVNENVLVNVPEGNFSAKKTIIGSVANTSLNQSQLTALQNSIFEISPEFNTLYGGGLYNPDSSYGVIAGAPYEDEHSKIYIYNGPEQYTKDGYHGLFQQYTNNYELIRIKGSFLTQFYDAHEKGNYGLEVEFYAKGIGNAVDIVSYRLDLNSFNGDPYCLTVYSPQSIVIKTQKNYLLGLKSIKLFEEEFNYDRLVEDGYVTDKENTTTPNIFVKDISLQFVDRKDLSNTNYYLMISAPKGIAITNNISKLELVGRLIYQGKDIMDSKCKCQWFVRDLSVMIGNERYSKTAGFGWAPLPQSSSSLTIDEDDVPHQQRYKLLVDYNNVVLQAEIEVFNHTSNYNYSITQQTNGDDIKLQITNNLNNEVLVGDWYMSYPDGSYSSIPEGKLQNSVSISPYLKYSSVIFYCSVYNLAKDKIIGTLEHVIINSESSEDVIITYSGEDTFRYDANGDIAIEDSEKERTLQVALTWKEGFGTAYSVEWVMRNPETDEEVILTNDRQNPSKSMMSDVWVDAYSILHYNIKQKYKVNFQNNTLVIKVNTVSGQTYLFQKEILFLKDGDQGTNGTTYVIAVRPCDGNGNKLSGFYPLVYDDGNWPDSLRLRCYVYKDGELINNNTKYSISYKWEGVNINFLSIISDRISVNGNTVIDWANSASCQFYVKVQVTIDDKINDRTNDIYATYPIDVILGDIDISKVDISSIPSYIKYTSSGTTPSFYSNNIECKYEDNTIDKDKIISLNTNILELEERESLQYIKPATSFIFENIKINIESNVGVLRCDLGEKYIVHPIIMYLDTYGNEAINGWDGTALETGNGEYVFAPQVGAGEKDSANRFTGVVMGKDSGQKLIGLYGYQSGLNTFGLLQNGKAFFGAKSAGGQIVIDGRYATLFGGNVILNESSGNITPASNGMYIRLSDRAPGSSTKAIGIGYSTHENESGRQVTEENFFVTYDGKIRATEANIHGAIYANIGQIGGTARQGGWTIQKDKLFSGSGRYHVELNSDQTSSFAIWAGKATGGDSYTPSENLSSNDNDKYGDIVNPAPFVVTRDGFLYATNARIKGNIVAKSGKIANWVIERNYLKSEAGNVGMASSGNAAFWAGGNLNRDSNSIPEAETESKFLVTNSGKLYCASAQVSGNITARSGKIGNWIIRNGRLENELGSVYLSPDKIYGNIIEGGSISIGSGFNVNSNGILTATNANISGAINASTLSAYTIGIRNSAAIGGSILGTMGNIVGTSGNRGVGITSSTVIIDGVDSRISGSNGVYISGGSFSIVGISANNQHGIYARFA